MFPTQLDFLGGRSCRLSPRQRDLPQLALLPMLGSRGAGQWGSGRTGHQEEFAEGVGWGMGESCFGPGPTVCGQAEMFTGGYLVSFSPPDHPAFSDSGNLGWVLS